MNERGPAASEPSAETSVGVADRVVTATMGDGLGSPCSAPSAACADQIDPDGDWSAGPWESTCVTRLIRQRQTTDCGVACLAMTAGISYECALEVFLQHGLNHKRKSAPLLSNFADLEKAARSLGLLIRRQRWAGWCRFSGVGVLKVKPYGVGGRKWHWVAAERHAQFGIVVRDPAFALAAIESAPVGVLHQALEHIKPCGCWLSVAADASPALALPSLFRR